MCLFGLGRFVKALSTEIFQRMAFLIKKNIHHLRLPLSHHISQKFIRYKYVI